MELFKLFGTIEIDNSKANEALDDTSDKGQKTQSKLSGALSKVGKGAAVAGKAVATGLAAGGAAFAGLTAKALSAGGELEQNMGGSEAVFGKYAGKMQDTAKKAFSNMGLSTSDFLATANKMGALFQGAGFDIESSSDLASSAMQRAADVASIMGIDTSAAMEAIAGAAKGNFTMMDNLGVAMNDTTLNAYAMEKGLNKTTQEMTNQEKIGLAMEMFMDKTAYAAGNYAKENETLAGSLGTAKSALTNFLDGSGSVEDLVSSFGNLANVAVKSLDEILPRLTSGMTDIVNQIMPMLPPLLNTLLPSIIEGAVSLINGLVGAFPGIVSALMGALPALIEGVTQIINALISALPQIMEALVSALPTLIPLLINGLVSMIVMLCTMLPQIIQPIIDYLPEIIVSIVNALLQNLPALIMGVISLVAGLIGALPQIYNALVVALDTLIDGWIASLAKWAAPIIQKVSQWWDGVKQATVKLWNTIKSAISTAVNAIKTVVSNVFNAVKTAVTKIWDGIKSATSKVWNGIKTSVSNIVNGVKTTVSNVFNGIKSTVTKIWDGIKSAIQKPIEKARDLVKTAIDKIKGFFSFKISWPNIPMPHFKIKPSGWKIGDLLKGSIPKLSIDWYAKAMNNPMLLTRPTIFGYDAASGKLQGGGESGAEVVSGANTLMHMIGSAVESRTAAANEKIIALLTALLEAITGGNKELLQALLAGQVIKINEREFGRTVREYA